MPLPRFLCRVPSHKRSRTREPETPPCFCCVKCLKVLVDPVTLPCACLLDQRCAQRLLEEASDGVGQCPCGKPFSVLPDVGVQLRKMVQQYHSQQVSSSPNPIFSLRSLRDAGE